MNTTDHWETLKAAGEVPPPSPEVLAHANRQLRAAARRHRIVRPAPVLAVAGTAAAVIGAIAVLQTTSKPVADPGPAGQPASSTTVTVPSENPSQGVEQLCAFGYSPEQLKKRGFAFDGTVLKIVRDPSGAIPSYLLTVQVHEWFRPGDGPPQLAVRTMKPPEGANEQVSIMFPAYTVGSRLLIAGDAQWGGNDPLKDPYAWGCGFSRAYNAGDAATWRKILPK